jgi:DNA repair ATPase RecN
MKIAKAMKTISRLKGEISQLYSRIEKSMSTIESNANFDESYSELVNAVNTATAQLVDLKNRVQIANINGGMFAKILELGELKNTLKFYTQLDIKSGVITQRFSEDTKCFKSQISVATKNGIIEHLQKEINDITDQLDEFNAVTEI